MARMVSPSPNAFLGTLLKLAGLLISPRVARPSASIPPSSQRVSIALPSGALRGADTEVADARKLAEKIKKKGGADLKSVRENLVDIVWGKSKPARPNEKVSVQPYELSGKEFSEKLSDIRQELTKRKSAGFVVCMFSVRP